MRTNTETILHGAVEGSMETVLLIEIRGVIGPGRGLMTNLHD